MGLLNKIVRQKQKEVDLRKGLLGIEYFKKARFPELRNFKEIFRKEKFAIIAEVKRFSPSAGIIIQDFDLRSIIHSYEEKGAAAISILTDYFFFGGNNEYIIQAKQTVDLPILRKDFIIDVYQIYESRWLGADAILLITRLFNQKKLSRFIELAHSLGLACLVEVHSLQDLKRALKTPAQIIGINNRNLDTQKIDLKNSFRLKRYIPDGYITISESGIRDSEDIKHLRAAGFDGVLVGEALLRAFKEQKIDRLLRSAYV